MIIRWQDEGYSHKQSFIDVNDIRALRFMNLRLRGKLLWQKVAGSGYWKEVAKDIIKLIKDTKFKVQAQIMDE